MDNQAEVFAQPEELKKDVEDRLVYLRRGQVRMVSFVSCSSNAGYIILVHKYHRQFRCCYWWRARHVGVYSWSCLRMVGLACWMNKLIDANSLMQ